MTENKFKLVHIYREMCCDQVEAQRRDEEVKLSKEQRPIADYLKAIDEYAPLCLKK